MPTLGERPHDHGPIVAEGYGRVADAFEAAVQASPRGGAALSVVVDGLRVVDLWGGHTDQGEWHRDTPTVVFSCSKGVLSVAVARLVEAGVLDLDAPVAQYWPEFAAAGKEAVTLRGLMSHRAGLSYPVADLTRDNVLAWDPVVAALAAQAPLWQPGTGWSYHALTWGWLVGEVVRRATGHDVGAALHELVAGPIEADFRFGYPKERTSTPPQVAPVAGFDEAMLSGLPNGAALIRTMTLGEAFPAGLVTESGEGFNDPAIRAAQVPGAGGIGTAAALADIWSSTVVATSATRPLDVALVADMTAPLTSGDPVVGIPGLPTPRWGAGFMIDSPGRPFLTPASFGHDGAGGQLGIADSDLGLGLGFVTSDMSADDTRVLGILEALRRCV